MLEVATMHPEKPLYVDTPTAAGLLGLSRSSLEKYRHYRDPKGPPFAVFGRGSIRYHVPSLLAWAQERTVHHGAE
ncbi:MAG TPA: excisionase [Maritimibacter sp.]|nr:excisionase [Maritimibacter sp.]